MKKIKNFNDFITESNRQSEIDRILDKISQFGIDSITPKEKAFLDDREYIEDINDDYDDEYNQYSNDKSKYTLIVYTMDPEEYHSTEIMVSAIYNETNYVVDTHFVEVLFEELSEIGLEDVVEGHMEYQGKLNPNDLVDKLKSLGFNSRIGNKDEVQ